ncbi:MAG: hypothetical protein U0795_01470 [Pirellulales bacterium]
MKRAIWFLMLSICSAAWGQAADDSFLERLQGTWKLTGENSHGNVVQPPAIERTGPATCNGSTWTFATSDGDSEYDIALVDGQRDPAAVKFDTAKGNKRKLSFVAMLHIEGDHLTLVRRMPVAGDVEKIERDEAGRVIYPAPQGIAPGQGQLIQVWERISQEVIQFDRPTLNVRLIDESAEPKTLVDYSIRTAFDGRFSQGGFTPEDGGRLLLLSSGQTVSIGTQVTGAIEDAGNESKRVALSIYLGRELPAEGTATVATAETISLDTILKPGEKARIDCGNHRWCELRWEP